MGQCFDQSSCSDCSQNGGRLVGGWEEFFSVDGQKKLGGLQYSFEMK